MKITINTSVPAEIEIPEYFSLYGSVGKVINEKHYLNVRPVEYSATDYPSIQVSHLECLGPHSDNIKQISKDQFDLEYIKTDRIIDNLRK